MGIPISCVGVSEGRDRTEQWTDVSTDLSGQDSRCAEGTGRGVEPQTDQEVPGKTETPRRHRWGGDRPQEGWGPRPASELGVRERAVEQKPLCFSGKLWGSVCSFWMAPRDTAQIGEHSGMQISVPSYEHLNINNCLA